MKLGLRLNLLTGQPVIFKLLATLRLTIEGNSESASMLGLNSDLTSMIASWANYDSTPVKSESSRLLAAIVKNAASKPVCQSMAEVGCLAVITPMLNSQHLKMKNEALMSLSIVATVLDENQVHAHLHTDLVVNSVRKCIIGDKNIPEELKKNAITLINQLMKSKTEEFKQILKDMNFKEDLMADQDAMALEGIKEMLEKL